MKDFAKKYFDLLNGELAGLNLTAINDFDDFYIKQIEDSFLPVDKAPHFAKALEKAEAVADIGFGGGFPLLVLAHLFPQKKFIGIEARKKKAEAVSFVAEKLKIKNVKTYHSRLEDILFDKNILLTFKAVGPCDRMLNLITTDERLKAFFYKGAEIEEKEKLKIKGWELKSIDYYTLSNDHGRSIVEFHANKNVPRGTKSLVRVSEFL